MSRPSAPVRFRTRCGRKLAWLVCNSRSLPAIPIHSRSRWLLCVLLSLACSNNLISHATAAEPIHPVVEIEEDVYAFEPANNGRRADVVQRSTCLVRIGDECLPAASRPSGRQAAQQLSLDTVSTRSQCLEISACGHNGAHPRTFAACRFFDGRLFFRSIQHWSPIARLTAVRRR